MHQPSTPVHSTKRELLNGALITVVTLIIGITAACTAFDAAPSECIKAAELAGLPNTMVEQLRKPDDLNALERAALQQALRQAGIDDICDVLPQAKPDIPGPAPNDQSSEREAPSTSEPPGARISGYDESRRRCAFWALNNLQPVVYNEFTNLNPDTMDDLNRVLWRSKLHRNESFGYYNASPNPPTKENQLSLPGDPGINCRDYWAEPLNKSNAKLRNQGFEASCRLDLEQHITTQYLSLADSLNYNGHNETVYGTPNQYVRILDWLDLSGKDLLNSDNPPYQVLQQQSIHLYAHSTNWIPTGERIDDYNRENQEPLNLDWLGIVAAAGLSRGSSDLRKCHHYYPQLFYGYWVPIATEDIPRDNNSVKPDLPQYREDTTPVYLPRAVSAKTIRDGYPLGKTADRYHLCRESSQTEEIGYYYVQHPKGNYCEQKP